MRVCVLKWLCVCVERECGVCVSLCLWDVRFVFWCCGVLCCVVLCGAGVVRNVWCVVSVVCVRCGVCGVCVWRGLSNATDVPIVCYSWVLG